MSVIKVSLIAPIQVCLHMHQDTTPVSCSLPFCCQLLGRIVDPNNFDSESEKHEQTYGIASDPIIQFAVVYTALIHDADHSGVPNAQLIKEKSPLAEQYKGKSVAEQHSYALAWDLLMREEFVDLRKTIFANDPEMIRFRQLSRQAVIATDIADEDLKACRMDRWEKTFGNDKGGKHVALEWKALAVIDCLIQASDIAHTMQHVRA